MIILSGLVEPTVAYGGKRGRSELSSRKVSKYLIL